MPHIWSKDFQNTCLQYIRQLLVSIFICFPNTKKMSNAHAHFLLPDDTTGNFKAKCKHCPQDKIKEILFIVNKLMISINYCKSTCTCTRVLSNVLVLVLEYIWKKAKVPVLVLEYICKVLGLYSSTFEKYFTQACNRQSNLCHTGWTEQTLSTCLK